MLTIILAALAVLCLVGAKVAESRGQSADERMGAIPVFILAVAFGAAALVSLAL